MNKKLIGLLFLIFVLFVVVGTLFYFNTLAPVNLPQMTQVTSNPDDTVNLVLANKTVKAKVANTVQERSMGLMYVQYLGKYEGMLFLFPKSKKHSFWMANTLIPLDIIWLNENWEIVHISENTPPCSEPPETLFKCPGYAPEKPARYVLELNGGWSQVHSLNVGDKVEFKTK